MRVLAVEDDAAIASVLRRGLRLAGHEVTVLTTVESARDVWPGGGYGLVLLDVTLPDGDGLELLAELREAGDETPCVLLTAYEERDVAERARKAGATGYLAKPFAYSELLSCVEGSAPPRAGRGLTSPGGSDVQ